MDKEYDNQTEEVEPGTQSDVECDDQPVRDEAKTQAVGDNDDREHSDEEPAQNDRESDDILIRDEAKMQMDVDEGHQTDNEEVLTQNDNKSDGQPISEVAKPTLLQLPKEILEKKFLSALISSDFNFPTHVCWTFKNMIAADPVFQDFERRSMYHLPRNLYQ